MPESITTRSQCCCCCSPRSISAPPGTPSLWPTRSQVDADETLRCLQPDLPLARRRLRSATSTASLLFNQRPECVREGLFQSRQVTRSVGLSVCRPRRTSHQRRLEGCRSSRSSTGEASERTTSCSPVVAPVWEADEATTAAVKSAGVIARVSGWELLK